MCWHVSRGWELVVFVNLGQSSLHVGVKVLVQRFHGFVKLCHVFSERFSFVQLPPPVTLVFETYTRRKLIRMYR